MGSGQLESRTHNQPFYTMYLKRIKKKCSQETVVCDIKNVMLYIILAIMAYSQKPFTKRLKICGHLTLVQHFSPTLM